VPLTLKIKGQKFIPFTDIADSNFQYSCISEPTMIIPKDSKTPTSDKHIY